MPEVHDLLTINDDPRFSQEPPPMKVALANARIGQGGYAFLRLDLDPAPLMLGFILGPMLEENFRRALLLSRGQFGAFFTRPISGTLLGLIGLFVVWQFAAFFWQDRSRTARTA